MSKGGTLAILTIGLVLGAGVGFTAAKGLGGASDGHDHRQHKGHSHAEPLMLPEGSPLPSVDAVLSKDAASGWNLRLATSNFRFSPERASQAHVEGEGHAHVYVNGEKLARLYGNWMHIGALPKGQVTLKVTLTTNDHRAIVADGNPVEWQTEIVVD